MLKRMSLGILASAVGLASGPAMAWEPALNGDLSHRTTITTISDIGPTYIIVPEALPADCPVVGVIFGPSFRDRNTWLGLTASVMDNPTGEAVARFLSVAMFARAQNARVRITIAGASAGQGSRGCYVTNITTCFDANSCVLPPAP